MAEGPGLRITERGLADAIARLKSLSERMPDLSDSILEDECDKMFSLSQSLCPVRTGTLLISGSHLHEFMKSRIGYNTPYAFYVENGTSKSRAKAYLRPAIREYESELRRKLGNLHKV